MNNELLRISTKPNYTFHLHKTIIITKTIYSSNHISWFTFKPIKYISCLLPTKQYIYISLGYIILVIAIRISCMEAAAAHTFSIPNSSAVNSMHVIRLSITIQFLRKDCNLFFWNTLKLIQLKRLGDSHKSFNLQQTLFC